MLVVLTAHACLTLKRKTGIFSTRCASLEMPDEGTWKTVTVLGTIPLKFDRLSGSNLPPKICIPSRAAMKMESMRRTRSAAMLAIELTNDFTRFPMLSQYLLVSVLYWEKKLIDNHCISPSLHLGPVIDVDMYVI